MSPSSSTINDIQEIQNNTYIVLLYPSNSLSLKDPIVFEEGITIWPIGSNLGEKLYRLLSGNTMKEATLQFSINSLITVDLNKYTFQEAHDRVDHIRLILGLLKPNAVNFELRAEFVNPKTILPAPLDCYSFTYEGEASSLKETDIKQAKDLYTSFYTLQANKDLHQRYYNALWYFHLANSQFYIDVKLIMLVTSLSSLVMTKNQKHRTSAMFIQRPLLLSSKLNILSSLTENDLKQLWIARCIIDHNGQTFKAVNQLHPKTEPILSNFKKLLATILIKFLEDPTCRTLLPLEDKDLEIQLPLRKDPTLTR